MSTKIVVCNPLHPDVLDPQRDLKMLVRRMKPEEEDQRPYDFGNVGQNQLSVDGYASKLASSFLSARRPPSFQELSSQNPKRDKPEKMAGIEYVNRKRSK